MSVSKVAERSAAYELSAAVSPPFVVPFDFLATAPQGIKEIRALILSLAASGRLLAQNAGDEPAGSLLRVLRDEWSCRGEVASKRRLGSQTLPVDAQRPTPSGWQYVRLGAVLDMFNGRAFKPTDWQSQGMPIVRIQNLNNPLAPYNHCDPTTIQPQHTIFKDTFLISWSGTPGTSFGAFIWTGGTAALNQHIFKCEQVAPVYLPAFLRLAINSQLDVLISRAHGGVGLQHVTKGTLENLSLPLPPLAEQARIVARVEELMQLCDALEAHGRLQDEQHARLVATLFDALAASESADALAENWQRIATHFDLLLDRPEAVDTLEQTLLQLAVRGLLVPQDSCDESATSLIEKFQREDLAVIGRRVRSQSPQSPIEDDEYHFLLPSSWVWVRLATVAKIASDLVNPSQFQDATQVAPDCIEKATGRLIKKRSVKQSGVTSANHRFHAGQILYSKIRPSLSKVIIVDFDGLCSADMYPIDTRMDSGYLQLFMLSDCFLTQVKEAENRVKMPKLNQEALNSFHVAVPPLAEQHRIVARVEQLRSLCANLRERLQHSRATQAHLADALVSVAAQSSAC